MTVMYAIARIPLIVSSILLGSLFMVSCGVTEPDDSAWRNVADFSWPTAEGAGMKFRTTEDAEVIDTEVEVSLADPVDPILAYHNGRQMFVMQVTNVRDVIADTNLENRTGFRNVHFLPMHDTLVVKQDEIGSAYALVAPLEKGHRWVAAYSNGLTGGDTVLVAEIIELFSYRKVEGKVYENVVAVKYSRPKPLPPPNENAEWVRFYAQGVGEIMTIRSVYPDNTNLSDPLPQQKERKVLLETTAVN